MSDKKSPAANPTIWRPTITTTATNEQLTPQEIKWPNDSPHHC